MRQKDKRTERLRAKDRRAFKGAAPVSFIESVLAEDRRRQGARLAQQSKPHGKI